MNLQQLRDAAMTAHDSFELTLRAHYPATDKFTWFRACEAVRNGKADRTETAMASDRVIDAAYADYISKLHAFYAACERRHPALVRLH